RVASRRVRARARGALRRAGRGVQSVQDDWIRAGQAGDQGSREPGTDCRRRRRSRAQKGGRSMIRINLLAAERERTKKKIAFPTGQRLTAVCSLMLVLAGGLIGWRYWSIGRDSKQLDTDIMAAGQETALLKTIIQKVQQFESQKSQLQERVALIEQLRKTQAGPVHMLDQISRAVPSMLWLTEL